MFCLLFIYFFIWIVLFLHSSCNICCCFWTYLDHPSTSRSNTYLLTPASATVQNLQVERSKTSLWLFTCGELLSPSSFLPASHPCSLDFVTSPPPSPKNLKSGVRVLPGGAKPELQQLKLGQLFWLSECVHVCVIWAGDYIREEIWQCHLLMVNHLLHLECTSVSRLLQVQVC